MVVKVGCRDAAHTQTNVFQTVPRYRSIDWAIEKLGALLHLVVDGHKALEEPGKYLLAVFIERHTTHLVHHRFDRLVRIEALCRTMCLPKSQIGGIANQVGRIGLWSSTEYLLVEGCIAKVAVAYHTLCIKAQRACGDVEL